MDPVILFFALGVFAGVAKSDLRVPPAIYDLLSMLLLLTIGLKGGVELARSPFGGLLPQILAVLAMGFALPLFLFGIARIGNRLARADAASLAAHYGSVSVATFAVGVAFLVERGVSYDSQLPLFLVLLEIPAIIVGILLARKTQGGTKWGKLMHEILLGKSIVLLVGGLLIGWLSGPDGIRPLEPLFFDLFKGVLALFLLEMGLIAAGQVKALREQLSHRRRGARTAARRSRGPGEGAAGKRPVPRCVRYPGAGADGDGRRTRRLVDRTLRRRHYATRRAGRQRLLHRGAGRHSHRVARGKPVPVTHGVPGRHLPVQHLPGHPDLLCDCQCPPWCWRIGPCRISNASC